MNKSINALALATCVAGAFAARGARAEDTVVVNPDGTEYTPAGRYDDWSFTEEPQLQSGFGVGIQVGGGVTGFTGSTLRSLTDNIGGLWSARVALGTHLPIAFEGLYVGSAQTIRSEFNTASATLIGTTVEGDVRINFMPHYMFTPYIFGGLGWQHYNINDNRFTLADTGMNKTDNLMDVPAGLGLSYRQNGFVGELRGTYRWAATGSGLVLSTTPSNVGQFASMSSWEASLQLGYEF